MEIKIKNNLGDKSYKKEEIITCSPNDTIIYLKALIKNNFKLNLSENRIQIYYFKNKIPEDKNKIILDKENNQLKDHDITQDTELYFEDLGLLINRHLAYFIFYIGPVFIVAYSFSNLKKVNETQNLIFFMSSFHYIKRCYESLYVHKFSINYLPIMYSFGAIIYYWGVYALCCSFFIFNSEFKEPEYNKGILRYIILIIFIIAEIGNGLCHQEQTNQKKRNHGKRGIPKGYGFDLTSSANYSWEFLSWICFSLIAGHWFSWMFTTIGFISMLGLAINKHEEYKLTFPEYAKRTKRIIPFIF